MFSRVSYVCTVYSCMFTYFEPCLLVLTFIYLRLLMFTYV